MDFCLKRLQEGIAAVRQGLTPEMLAQCRCLLN
jgi:hypothetical protein